MRRRFFIALLTFCLMLPLFSSSPQTINAQEKDGNNQTKPSGKAKKLVAQGDQFFNKKDYRSAITKYAEAIVLSPKYSVAHYWKGYAHYYLNEFNETIEELNTAFDLGYKPLEIYKLRWYVSYQKGDYETALRDAEAGLKLDPQNKDFARVIGEIYFKNGSYPEAISALEKIIQTEPNNGDLQYFLAASYAKTGNIQQQASTAKEAINKNTKFLADAYLLLGDALLLSNNNAEAIEAFKKAISIKSDMPEEFFVTVSELFRSENRLNEAADLAYKGLKLYPQNSELLINLTWYYSLSDRFVEAVSAGQQAIRNAPDNFAAHTNLCRAYNDLKQYPQAIFECNKALKINPTDGETFFYLGFAHASTKKDALATDYYKKAVANLSKFARDNPKDADGHYLLGNAYYSDKQTKKAIESYKKSLELSPNFAKAHLNLGFMHIVDQNIPAAREQYNILLKLNKGYAEKLSAAMEN